MELSSISFGSISLDSYPNSIQIIGDFKARVQHVEHANLTRYVECFRNKNERVTLVQEVLPSNQPHNIDLLDVAKQVLNALDHLHNSVGSVHGLIDERSIVWDDRTPKLADWPINLLTGGGAALGSATILPINVSFVAPEQVKDPKRQATTKCDIWSTCLVLLRLIKPSCKVPENPTSLAFCGSSMEVLRLLEADFTQLSLSWAEFFRRGLEPNPELRASIEELYSSLAIDPPTRKENTLFRPIVPDYFQREHERVTKLDISEIYYLWRLSIGRNMESEQKLDDCPPIFKIPELIVNENQRGPRSDVNMRNYLIIDTRPKIIPLDVFKADMRRLDETIFEPLILTDEQLKASSGINGEEEIDTFSLIKNRAGSDECNNNAKAIGTEPFTFADLNNLTSELSIRDQINDSSRLLPIVIKEADCSYQCERIILFKRLLAGCPYLKDELKRQASIDIPPYYRAQVWAKLLDICPSKDRQLYKTIEKTTPVATDRQISVDIPRCHQYNELMASPQGHQKLARILKTWLNHNSSKYVYWQGLDSLAAPFLLLNFNDEAVAFACFNAFVDKYLCGFFKKDNQIVVQQYLSMFSELLSYHDPSLALHLEQLGFLPNLYAIPWFLTMFTHVLPLHKILHVWDCLLLGDEKFPLCIGLAILNQLKHELLEFGFNDCIVAFSNLPEIDIERCIRDASQFYNSTPDKVWN